MNIHIGDRVLSVEEFMKIRTKEQNRIIEGLSKEDRARLFKEMYSLASRPNPDNQQKWAPA